MFSAIIVGSVLFGLVMGSFAGAQVWRLRGRQLKQDRETGEEYDKAELKRLNGISNRKTSEDRSQCLSCGHELAWYDLVPIFSWVSTKGRCRYCRKRIGSFEPLIEVGTAAIFGLFTWVWISTYGIGPVELLLLSLWYVALTLFVILFVYDLKWFLLPDVIMFPLIALSVLITGITIVSTGGLDLSSIVSVVAGVGILAGLYFILWYVSKGLWVGFGDVKLGIALGTLLIDWKLAFLTLFLANLLGTLVVLPGLMAGKLSRKAQVPFGPFLMAGFFISLLFGAVLLGGYNDFSVWLTSVMLML